MIDFLGSPLETPARCHVHRVPVASQWLARFEDAGLLSAVAEEARPAARNAILAAEFPLVVETGRVMDVDAVGVARSGVRLALLGFFSLPVLRGHSWGEVEDLKSDGESYCLRIGETEYRLWSTMETARFADAYLTSFSRMVRLMNALLRGRGVAERVYYHYARSESRLFLLSAQLYRRLVRAGHFEVFYGGCPPEA